MKSNDDSVVVKQVLQGDEAAFASLVSKYRDTIHALAYHYMGNFHDAEEITQEVFIKAYRSLETLEEHSKFGIWLHSIARNHATSWLRRAKKEARMPIESRSAEITSISLRRHGDDKLRELVIDAVSSLPENEKMVVDLYYLGGAISSEIGRILDVPAGTVRYWLHCAKQHLREELGMVRDELRMRRLPSRFTKQVMDSLGKMEGSVIGMDGKPLGNIRLTLDTIMGEFNINSHDFIQVDGDGHFLVDIPSYSEYRPEHLDIVRYQIMYYGQIGEDIRHASTPIIALRPGEKYRGIVLDLRKDIHTLRIRAVDANDNPIGGAHILIGIGWHGCGCAITEDADGLTPSLHLSSLEYRFCVCAHTYAPNSYVYLTVPDGLPEDGVLNVRLEKGGRIAGKVVDSDGNPVANACLAIRYYAHEASGHRVAIGRNFSEKPDFDDAQTKEDGHFALTMLYPHGNYCIQACHPDYGVDGKVDIPVGSEDVVFQLKPVVSLAGKVLKRNRPISDGWVSVNLLEAGEVYRIFEDNRIRPDRSACITVRIDASGAFRIPYLFPGCFYQLEIQHGGSEYTENIQLTSQPENHITIRL